MDEPRVKQILEEQFEAEMGDKIVEEVVHSLTPLVEDYCSEKIEEMFGRKILEKCEEVLNTLKETLMLSLIGHMNEEKRKWEEKWGSGRIQEAYGTEPGFIVKTCEREDTAEVKEERDPDLVYGDEEENGKVCYSGAGLSDKELYEIHNAIRKSL